MLLSEIHQLLKGQVALEDFKRRSGKEISDYRQSLSKKGGSSPILLNEDLEGLLISEANIRFLCEAFLQNELDEWELNYISEALLLSDKVTCKSNKVEEALMALTDSEYFELIGTEFIESILNDLLV